MRFKEIGLYTEEIMSCANVTLITFYLCTSLTYA